MGQSPQKLSWITNRDRTEALWKKIGLLPFFMVKNLLTKRSLMHLRFFSKNQFCYNHGYNMKMANIGFDDWLQISGVWFQDVNSSNWVIGWIVFKDLHFCLLKYDNWDGEGTAKTGCVSPFFGAHMHRHEQKCVHLHALDYCWYTWISFSIAKAIQKYKS